VLKLFQSFYLSIHPPISTEVVRNVHKLNQIIKT